MLLLDRHGRLDQAASIKVITTAPGNGSTVSYALHCAGALKPCPGEVKRDNQLCTEGKKQHLLVSSTSKCLGAVAYAKG